MDRTDEVLREFFTPAAPPALGARLRAALRAAGAAPRALGRSFRVEASARGVRTTTTGPSTSAVQPCVASR